MQLSVMFVLCTSGRFACLPPSGPLHSPGARGGAPSSTGLFRPSRSGRESEAWFRHPRLPTHHFLSRIEDERGWWLRASCLRPCDGMCVCASCVIGKVQCAWSVYAMYPDFGLRKLLYVHYVTLTWLIFVYFDLKQKGLFRKEKKNHMTCFGP